MGSCFENSKPSSIAYQDDNADIMASFRKLGLGDCKVTSFNHNSEVGSSSLSMYSEQSNRKEDMFNGWQANGDFQRRPVSSYVAESRSESPVCRESLWAYHPSIDGGSHQPSYLESGSGIFTRRMNDGVNYLGHDLVTSPKTPLQSYSNYASDQSAYAHQTLFSNPESACTTSFSNHLHGVSLSDDQACYYGRGNNMSNGYNIYYPTNGVSSCNNNGYNLHSIGGTSAGSVLDLVTLAMTPTGSRILHRLLRMGDNETRKWILVQLLDSIPELMTDPNGHRVFQKLISFCTDNEFHIIAMKLTSEDRFLPDAAFNIKGSHSVQHFIKKLKKSPMASTVTYILSMRFFEMMTHPLARHVIKQCLNVLGFLPNMVLYEAAIDSCYTLAVHSVGCVSINDCIDFIMGPQRDTLLQRLADQSAYLASDPSGNYVVQHVLKTRNPMIVDRVCLSLWGHYRELSAKKGGSHVIELCVKYSSTGMNFAVQEFLENSKALVQLAKDEFGNYVVQTMLKVTKVENIQLYEALIEALEPHLWFLERYKTGRRVATLIRKNLDQPETNELE